MFVDQGLILPLFPGCNKDESILGKVDIDYVDYVDIKSDAKLFYKFVCHKDLLIRHAQKITTVRFNFLKVAVRDNRTVIPLPLFRQILLKDKLVSRDRPAGQNSLPENDHYR
jgi:hypothetical protein